MTRRLGGFRKRGFPILASLSLVTTLACGGVITGCGGDDNGGGGGESDAAEEGLESGPLDGATDAAKDAGKIALDSGTDGGTDSATPDSGILDSAVADGTLADSAFLPTVDGAPAVDAPSTSMGDAPSTSLGDAPSTPLVDATVDAPNVTPSVDGSFETGGDASTAPVASFPLSTITLGAADCGGAAVTTAFLVKNVGGGTLTVNATVAGTVFSVTPASLSVAAGATGTLTVKVTAPSSSTAGGTLNGSLSLTTNDAGHANASIPLTSSAQGVTLAWSPSAAAFGVAPNGLPAPAIPLTLTNTGNVAATNVALTAPTPSGQFTLSPLSVASIGAGGGTASLSAGFTPNSLNPSAASSNITFTGAVCGSSVTTLGFTGQGGLGAVTGWPSPSVPFDFMGGACGGPAPAPKTFVLTNTGPVPVHITSVTFGGPTSGYTTDVTTSSVIAASGGTLTVTVTPPAIPAVSAVPGNFGATLTLTTDVQADSAHVINLTENAVGAILSFDTTATAGFGAFGPVSDGSALPQSFKIVNSGNALSHVTLATTTPFSVGSAVFSVAGDPTQPFDNTATFTPTTPGPANGVLTIAGDNLCQPLPAALPLVGVGQGGFPFIPTGSLTFAANCATTAAPQTFTITNTGNLPMTWTAADFDPTLYAVAPTTAVLPAKPSDPTDLSNVSVVTVTPLPIPQFPTSTLPSAFASLIHITTDVVGDSPHTVTLSETPLGDVLSLVPTPSPLDFGHVPIDTLSNGPAFTIVNAANPGSLPANATVVVGGTNSADFTTAAQETILPGGQSAPIGITFQAPGTPALYTGTLGITAGADVLCAPLPAALPLTGTATEAGPLVQPPSLSFGTAGLVNCGATAAPQSVAVTNTGTQDFTILGATSTNPTYFTVAVSPPDGIVHANLANVVTITVTPQAIPAAVTAANLGFPATSIFSGALTITTNANSGSPVLTVPLAMGAEGAIVTGDLSTTNWAFGNVTEFGPGSSTFSVPITNQGNEPLQITMSNSNPVFVLTPSPTTVGPNGVVQLTATFTPINRNASASSTDIGHLDLEPTTGNVFCEPVPASWGQPLALSGSSTTTFPF